MLGFDYNYLNYVEYWYNKLLYLKQNNMGRLRHNVWIKSVSQQFKIT